MAIHSVTSNLMDSFGVRGFRSCIKKKCVLEFHVGRNHSCTIEKFYHIMFLLFSIFVHQILICLFIFLCYVSAPLCQCPIVCQTCSFHRCRSSAIRKRYDFAIPLFVANKNGELKAPLNFAYVEVLLFC